MIAKLLCCTSVALTFVPGTNVFATPPPVELVEDLHDRCNGTNAVGD